jgi:hypothetical protein
MSKFLAAVLCARDVREFGLTSSVHELNSCLEGNQIALLRLLKSNWEIAASRILNPVISFASIQQPLEYMHIVAQTLPAVYFVVRHMFMKLTRVPQPIFEVIRDFPLVVLDIFEPLRLHDHDGKYIVRMQ